MQTGYYVVTRELAEKWLATQVLNRAVNSRRVQQYAEDMKNGNWAVNGESIKFMNGVLVDGQHRLHAVLRSGVAVRMLVVEVEDARMIDRGQERNLRQSLKMMGVSDDLDDQHFSEMAKMHFALLRGRALVSDREYYEFILRNQEAFLKLRQVMGTAKKKGARTPYRLAMFYALVAGESVERLKEFHKIFMTGFYSAPTDSAAVVYRNDFYNGNLPIGGNEVRMVVLRVAERAIYDFCRETKRTKTYRGCDEAIYSKESKIRDL